ncbi:MAG: CRISPR-associated endoribonuclease Cas6 [Bacteroidales bacterium]
MTKTLLGGSPFSQRFEESAPGYSPYVFSIHFSKIHRVVPEQEVMIIRPPVFMTFSTGLFDLMTHICNRAIVMKDKDTVLGLNLDQIQLLPNKTIRSDAVKFQVVGHAVLRGRDDYLDNTDASQIEEAINTQLKTKLSFLNQNIAPLNNSVYSPIKVIEHRELAKGVCQHYGGKITSIRGNITLAGYPASLQFLYDYGLGIRTGQGFGLLEVVKQL